MIARSYEYGRFTSAVAGDGAAVPRIWAGSRPVVYCHSSSMDGGQMFGGEQLPSIATLIDSLVGDGWSVVAPSIAALWGNATARSRIDDALRWIRARNGTDEPAVLIGASMGAAAALSWANTHTSDVACVIGIIPAVDLEAIRTANTGSLRAPIDTAYGVTYPAALPAGSNPVDMTNLDSIPVQLWTASDDAVSANAATGLPNAEIHNVGALGHTDAAVAAVDVETVATFIQGAIA